MTRTKEEIIESIERDLDVLKGYSSLLVTITEDMDDLIKGLKKAE